MKNEDLLLLAAVAVGVFVVMPALVLKKTANQAGKNTGIVGPNYATEIMRADGWTYYTDGTSIDPNGRYYKGSDMVYDPKGMYQ